MEEELRRYCSERGISDDTIEIMEKDKVSMSFYHLPETVCVYVCAQVILHFVLTSPTLYMLMFTCLLYYMCNPFSTFVAPRTCTM